MKTFKSFLVEVPGWSGSLSEKLFDIGFHQGFERGGNLIGFWLPISSSIFKRIGIEEVRATVFHVTDKEHYPTLKKLQGKKQSISAFFGMKAEYFEQGVQTKGGVIAELDANILSAWKGDVMSSPDKGGRRWVKLAHFKGVDRDQDIQKVLVGVEKLIGKLLLKYHSSTYMENHDGKLDPVNYPGHWQALGQILGDKRSPTRDTKKLSLLIKDYIDGMEKVMKSNVKQFKEIFQGYLSTRFTDNEWDEQIVNKIKIKKVHLVFSDAWYRPDMSGDPDEDDYKGYEDFIEELKADGIKGKYYKDPFDLEKYISNVATLEPGR